MENNEVLTEAKEMIRAEGRAILSAADQIDDTFLDALNAINECSRNILVSAVGTSGTIARRFAHLLSSCGMTAFFFHPGEALHGPSALVKTGDVVIALSKAGKSSELNDFIKIAKNRGGKTICFTADPKSELAQLSDIVIEIQTDTKGEGEGIFPFGSSLVNAAIGDALCLLARRKIGFELAELEQTHPSGATADLVKRDP